ncbi:hypothetical protein K438DRAFT_1493603, partial [Mycena galopus ATCC 62051]
MKVNGMAAFTLFNSGCMTEACSPDFAQVAGLKVFPTHSEITLQLGTAGSRSKINHGVTALCEYNDIKSEEYLDIVNLDQFDIIVGTKFMRKHKMSLDFQYNTICVAGVPSATEATNQHIQEMETGGVMYTEDDIPRLRDRWMEISMDIMSGVLEKMPPMRAVNHQIPLIDEELLYHYHLPQCPDVIKPQLSEKIQRYTRAGWWEPVQTDQAALMLRIPK